MSEARPLPPVQHVNFQTQSVEEATMVVSTTYNPVRMRPIRGSSFHLEANAVLSGGLCFTRAQSHSGISYDFENPFDGYGWSLPVGGNFTFDTIERENLGSDGSRGVIVDSSKVSRAVFSSQGAWRRVSVDSQSLHEHLVALTDRPVRGRVSFAPMVAPDSKTTRMLLALSDAFFQGVEGEAPLLNAPSALSHLKDAVLSLLLEALPHSHSSLLQGRLLAPAPRQVKRAIDFIHANAQSPIQLKDIAAAAGITPRSLQLAFRKFRDMSPMAYLRMIRLEGARAELLAGPPGTRVAAVAYRWGFGHLGMFAAQFAEMYGETPSATLNRVAKIQR